MSAASSAVVQKEDKETEILAKELELILTKDRIKLLTFLKEHGKQEKLISLIKQIEKNNPTKTLVWKSLLEKPVTRGDWLYEIPTNELCLCLIRLFKHFNITKILEPAAGNGLLAARVNSFDASINIVPSNPDRKLAPNNDWSDITISFSKVENARFSTIDEKNTPVLVSWLHKSQEDEFLDMVKRNLPSYVFLVGETERGCNYTEKTVSTMKKLRYGKNIIPAKQLSSLDYFLNDRMRKPNDTRTVITLFCLNEKEMLEEKQMISVCSKENLASFPSADSDFYNRYVLQDLQNQFVSTSAEQSQLMLLTLLLQQMGGLK